ncbi:coiled-coil and C2 domain-containing protein 1B [Ictalurus punctatus]|uniref:Coiled-coil and C2 domain-containing protein 1B n=1 Tax=Ictalurus punctatus TaxID=7998 RepID=A0A9F7TAY6_ICTPU|nr:coiled-coil and C2 domain-containing protein 1B [Ictalurus punctatus]XP_053529770.1 coiled-coil and C2 domain-containing protein 1B [Ictalurus punctatus]XP_053529771.1 coiled-coil and C2 domain-containing protein 1B [Ictalurus punctatus]XP_053529772.1 coiled-coil and C2 domain-containing protein 1B [Ictalurus punctatus]XP_053529773.1 coiled-coil and C2 domain-containing protein 1B [Ictalurus punctatus]
MFARKNKRPAAPKGQGAAAAKQMGLFLDFNPEDMMDVSVNVDDPDLEAEFAAIVGKKPTTAAKGKKTGKAPLPMEDIEKMTEACMKDLDDDDDDDDDLEDDEDLLAELQEVVGEEETDSGAETATSPGIEETGQVRPEPQDAKASSTTPPAAAAAVCGSVEHRLQERIVMYNTAITNAKAAGESGKARRYERGLKTLQSMLASVRKGGKINEAEIPPPVASGNRGDAVPPSASPTSAPSPPEHNEESDSAVETSPVSMETISVSTLPEVKVSSAETSPVSVETSAGSLEPPASGDGPSGVILPEEERIPESPAGAKVSAPSKEALLERQKQYRMAAVRAKQAGDLEQAKTHMKSSKSFDAALAALAKGESVDLGQLPPPLSGGTESSPKPAVKISQSSPNMQAHEAAVNPLGPVPPRTVLEALEQRMDKYKETCDQAKANGDERKARMYDRIVKQYQSAIRSHKAGRAVNYEELPVPPGFPPIPGQEAIKPEQGLAAALETASKLASNEADGGDDDDEEEEEETKKESKQPKAPAAVEKQKKQMMAVPQAVQHPKRTPSPSPERPTKNENPSSTVTEQVEMLEARRKQYMKAALQAKQKNDMEQARVYLRTAKSFEPLITAARSGKHVDLSKVPSPPADEDEDFIVVHHSEVEVSERAEEVYTQLSTMLKEQYEKCLTYSKQFTHMGNIAETTKFENIAERCKKSLEILKLAQNRGLEPPKHHFEERTYRTVRIFPELSSSDMVVMIVKGMNLPAPHGVAANDLDAYVRFEFPYPSTDQPQRQKTAVIKNNNSPEYNQSFTLNINRNHRSFKRAVQTKGLKLEVFHKGGFLRSDKPVGTAHVKLDKLETESEVREIVEVMDGRKPTGGRIEVRVRLREPLSGQDMQTVTERWLVLDQSHSI